MQRRKKKEERRMVGGAAAVDDRRMRNEKLRAGHPHPNYKKQHAVLPPLNACPC